MDKKLINAVKRQIGSDAASTLQDVVNHGADFGVPGFTYYSDTRKFYKNNRREIVALVKEYAQEFGQEPIEFVAGFNCLRHNDKQWQAETREEVARALYGNLKSDDTQVPNALAWFAVEEVARALYDN